jgi:predicted nucleic acid-binding protein
MARTAVGGGGNDGCIKTNLGEAMIARASPRPKTVYVETSVWGMTVKGQNPALRAPTLEFLRRCTDGDFVPYISRIVLDEIDEAPDAIQVDISSQVAAVDPTVLALSNDVEVLADRFIGESILPSRRRADGLHVAFAIVHGIELVVSWNYRHIANQAKADAFRAVALLAGWPAKFEIHTPFEVLQWN